jgi:hypothetical protein
MRTSNIGYNIKRTLKFKVSIASENRFVKRVLTDSGKIGFLGYNDRDD